ncbi:hypothetical protein LXA43DRAFT_242735 [Ganoderma leucocontextum]|nr:hypothetical protein LXA43DRAFT_242735 [Ganoderma leucocontextum]
MVRRWKSEIDMLLVFAGLFSAVLTAFNVQSYQLLQPDEQGEVLAALVTISSQLNGYTHSPPFINSTFNHRPDTENSFTPPTYAVWLNSLWFSALICTLSASSIAITVRQWLHQYSSGLSGTSREVARLRQYRYESLIKWQVAGIVTMLPVLLQLALILFLAGLLILLWTIHPQVALVASILVGVLLSFNVTVTVIPAFRADCCYQSPAALSFFRVLQYFGGFIRLGLVAVDKTAYSIGVWRSRTIQNICWSTRRAVRRALRFQGTWGMFNTWEVRERHETHRLAPDLDFSLLEKVYQITLDDHLLETAMARCLKSLEPEAAIRGCIEFLHRNTTVQDLFAPNDPDRDNSADVRFAQGRRRARYQTFLFTQVLTLVPRCAASIGPSTRRPFEDVARKVLALLPPKVAGPAKYISYGDPEQGVDNALMLRALASLVCHDLAPAESFLKLVVNVRQQFDVQRGSGGNQWIQSLDMDVLQQVVNALPATYQEVSRRIDWRYALLAEYYFAAVTSIIHAILRVRSAHPGVEDARTRAQLQRVMASVEAVLSHPSWKASSDAQSQVMWAVCNAGSHSWRTNAHAFLPTLAQLAADFSSREVTDRAPEIVPASLLRIIQECLETYGQAQLSETPELVGAHHRLGLLSTRTGSLRSVNVLQGNGGNGTLTSGELHVSKGDTDPPAPRIAVRSSPEVAALVPSLSLRSHPIPESEVAGKCPGNRGPEPATVPAEDPSMSSTLLNAGLSGLAIRTNEGPSISSSMQD